MKRNNNFRMPALIAAIAILILSGIKFNLAGNIFSSIFDQTESKNNTEIAVDIQSANAGESNSAQTNTLPVEKSSLPDFTNDGWKKVSTLPPDENVVELSPTLIPGREEEIYDQLSSGAIGPRHLGNMLTIFNKTKDEKIRYRIIEALANLETAESEKALREVYKSAEESERNQIIGRLNPTKDEQSHNFLIATANEDKVESRPAISALASAHLFSGNSTYLDKTLAGLNSKSRENYLKVKNKIQDFDWTEHNHNEHIKKEQL